MDEAVPIFFEASNLASKIFYRSKRGIKMKSFLAALLACMLLLSAGCTQEPSEIKIEKPEENTADFHEIDAAEKIAGGVLYYDGNKLCFDKDGKVTELADEVQSLWRENNEIYYDSADVLYAYNFDTASTKTLAKNPQRILGKYKDSIISYAGRNIYAINEAGKTAVFKDGYYLNSAVLYKNKVYGIPATNVYEYDLDTLEVKKVTKNRHDLSYLSAIGDDLYIVTQRYKNLADEKCSSTYFKLTDDGAEKEFTLKNPGFSLDLEPVKDGFFLSATLGRDDTSEGCKLLYIQDGKQTSIDEDYTFELVGISDNKLLYYKNNFVYGSFGENMTTFYLFDGQSITPAFDLQPGSYEAIDGYTYDDGVLIEISHESSVSLYKYDGQTLEELDTPYIFSIIALDIIDGKAYIRYSDGEESTDILGTIIALD